MAKIKFLYFAFGFIFQISFAVADEDFQCHDLYEYDASTKGTVSSPFYGERPEYPGELWCEYMIRAPDGYRIKLTFLDLDIDPSMGCGQDQLAIYGINKNKLTNSMLGTFCGRQIPQPILSSEGESEIKLVFRTDYIGAGRGFKLQFESAPHIELCEAGSIVCGNRRCYQREQKCDGVDDCGDGTDEEDCNLPIVSLASECGVQAIHPNVSFIGSDRMVGGDEALPNSWPWQVSLQFKNSEPNGHFCGGTIINAQWILTASHCVVVLPMPGQMKIVAGAHNKFTKTPYEQIRYSSKIIAFPDLEEDRIKGYAMKDDISLIKLNAPLSFNKGVHPACLPKLGWTIPAGSQCYATGWGESRGTGGSDVLKQMKLTVASRQVCRVNQYTQICLERTNNSPCHGDSGGPLHCKSGNRWFVFGAASYVTTTNFVNGLCTGPDARVVYASASDKADWINTIINKYT